MSASVLVVGLAATGAAVVDLLAAEGASVTIVDDRLAGQANSDPADPEFGTDFAERIRAARARGFAVLGTPDDPPALLARAKVQLVVPSPGVRPSHPLLVAARAASIPVRSEIDLAAERIAAPMVAVTGTNGKTTVTELVTQMLAASGFSVECAGNIGTPLVAVAASRAEFFVAEVSSFQLEFTTAAWHPRVAVLLNIDDDHLDWHGSRAEYEAAKAKVFAHQTPGDTLVVGDDDAARRLAKLATARLVEVAVPTNGDLVLADGTRLLNRSELPRALPHDCSNSVAAAEAAFACGADLDAVRSVLRGYRARAHRVELVARFGDVSWYDDSKATNPHATRRAVSAFDSVVLCAGGLNKGLDLSVLAQDCARVRAVVAFGSASREVADAFMGCCPVEIAVDMDDVVARADRLAQAGDVVLLSPACASFDAYSDYAARGNDFARAVRARLATVEATS